MNMKPTAGTGGGHQTGTTSKLEYWQELRGLIVHEDNLVNHRFSWLLTYEGFLMGGFFLIQGGLLSGKMPPSVLIWAEGFLLVVLLLSMWICYITGQTICAAYRQTANVFHAWVGRYPEETREPCPVPHWFFRWKEDTESYTPPAVSQKREFPPILGYFKYSSFGKTPRIPLILCVINLLAACACLAAITYAHKHPEAFAQQPPATAPVENKTILYDYKQPDAISAQRSAPPVKSNALGKSH